jgi:hypothetical protein
MTNATDVFTITIRRRPWWFWGLAGLWLLLVVLILQTAFASVRESEYRAATISWIATAVLVGIGVFAWLCRGRSRRLNASSDRF